MDKRKPKYSGINRSEYQCVHINIHLDRPGFEDRASALKGQCLLFHGKKICVKRSQCHVIIALFVLLLYGVVRLLQCSKVTVVQYLIKAVRLLQCNKITAV